MTTFWSLVQSEANCVLVTGDHALVASLPPKSHVLQPIIARAIPLKRDSITFRNCAPDGKIIQIVVEAGAALLVLLVVAALSVYKRKGMTPYGWRKQHEQRALSPP